MNYAILRTQKLKSTQSIHRSMKHAFRAQNTPNADPELTPNNTHIGAKSVTEAMCAFKAALPEKVRKNGVLCIEYLITASPEAMINKTRHQQDDYFYNALGYLRTLHGNENVVYAGIHRDEKTPHMYAYVVPIDPNTGRLNCRLFLGGAKALSKLQTDFYEKVAKKNGLWRGEKGSKATHQSVKKFYAAIDKPLSAISVDPIEPQDLKPRVLERNWLGMKTKVENSVDVARRLTQTIHEKIDRHVNTVEYEALQRREMQQSIQAARKIERSLKPLVEALNGLSNDEVREIEKMTIAHAQKIHKNKQASEEWARIEKTTRILREKKQEQKNQQYRGR